MSLSSSNDGSAGRRDRAATEARILEAARTLLARDGFLGLGHNALAAEAGCDKKLITRYFGDMDGVIEALGADLQFWVDPPSGTEATGSYGARMRSLFQAYARSLRTSPLLQRILAWELVTPPSDALGRLEAARSSAIGTWFMKARGDTTAPANVDAPAVHALLLAGLHYLTLREQTVGSFANLDLRSDEGRARIDAAAALILTRLYDPPQTP